MTAPSPATPRATDGGRRLATLLRHATHTFAGILWLVGCLGALHRRGPLHWVELALAMALAAGYLAGLALQGSSIGRNRRGAVGSAWVMVLVVLWGALVALGQSWTWLCFPLDFLALFILRRPLCWLVVASTALWAVLATPLRGEPLGVGQVVGPLFGAGFAVVVAAAFDQLRRDAAEQRRLDEQLAGLAAERARLAEREAIARDLHDTLAQQLNSIVMLGRTGAQRHPEAAEVFGGIEQVARDGLVQARGLVHQLAGTGTSAGHAVAQVVDEVAERERLIGSGIILGFEASGEEAPLPEALRQDLAMATRSLLANVVQHAGAGRCQVSLSWFDDEVCLDVVDDGTGFDPAAVGTDSFGLAGVRARVQQAGGTMELDTAPGQGTSVALRWPLPGMTMTEGRA